MTVDLHACLAGKWEDGSRPKDLFTEHVNKQPKKYVGAIVAGLSSGSRLARRSEIPSFKVGKDWRFRKEALTRWSDEQSRGAAFTVVNPDKPCSVLVIDDDEKF